MTCDRCYQDATVGAHGVGVCPFEPRRSSGAVHQDSVEGGFYAENGFDKPTYFESKKAHRDALAARGLTIGAKWAGPNDKHLSRMDIPCQTTLENAKALLSRSKSTPFAPDYEPVPIEVTPVTFEKDA